MKSIDRWTEAELLEITEEDTQALIDYECAKAGIRLEPELPEEPESKIPEGDIVYYEIEDVRFTDKKQALRVLELINSCKRIKRNYGPGYQHYIFEDQKESVKFEQQTGYSKQMHEKIRVDRAIHEKEQADYKTLKDEYEKIMKERIKIVQKVKDAIFNVDANVRKLAALKNDYRRYLKLAEGDGKIAFNFLINSRPDEKEKIEKLKAEIATENIIESAKKVNHE